MSPAESYITHAIERLQMARKSDSFVRLPKAQQDAVATALDALTIICPGCLKGTHF